MRRERNGNFRFGDVRKPFARVAKPMRQSLRVHGFVTRLDGTCKASQSTDTRQAPSTRVFVESLLAQCRDAQGKYLSGSASSCNAFKSKAVSHWRRWFIEVFSLQGTAVQATEQHESATSCKQKQRGQPFTEGCPSRFRLSATYGKACTCKSSRCKQKQRGKAIQ